MSNESPSTQSSDSLWHIALTQEINDSITRFRRAKWRWNRAYFICLYLSIATSGFAAYVLKLNVETSFNKEDASAFLATVATILGGVIAAGQFDMRRRAARRALANVLLVKTALLNPAKELTKAAQEYQDAIKAYEAEVSGQD